MRKFVIARNVRKFCFKELYEQGDIDTLVIDGPFRVIDFDFNTPTDAFGREMRNDNLKKLLSTLNENSLLQLIEYCPKVCFAIPSERCSLSFLAKAEDAIVSGVYKRMNLDRTDRETILKEVSLLKELKKWKQQERDKHATPNILLMDAIKDFRDNSKPVEKPMSGSEIYR